MRSTVAKFLLILPLAGLLQACTTEKIVYRDRDPFNEPVAAALGFLGYYSAETQRTTCGNCHADFQGKWQGSAHAGAFASLPATAQDFCKSCHSVNQRGNMVTELAGWDATKDAIYQDVQCESCHGPGLDHVRAVNQGQVVRPLAKLGMNGEGTCADCHSGAHHPYAEEWGASNHAKPGTRASSATCAPCHEGRGALNAWGVDHNYLEKSTAGTAPFVAVATCATCHDPHGSDNPAQLRFPINVADASQNLCIRCHLRVDRPEDNRASPHAPQGSVLLGSAGYRPSGFIYEEDRIFGSHATERNPELCAGCHVAQFTVTDPQGGFVQEATGHLMRAIPCLDAEGKPTADKNCDYSATARSWATCTNSGCHANAGAAASAFNSRRDLMALLTGQLWINTDGDGTLDAAPTDAGLLAQVKQLYPGEWGADNRVSPAEGAEFNARLCGNYNQSTADNSRGTHNPFLCTALLSATITEIVNTYALPAPPAEIQAIIDANAGSAAVPGLQRSSVPIRRAEYQR